MLLCMIFGHVFGRDGFRSMVLDATVFGPWYLMLWPFINIYYNIEWKIMKNQVGSPSFGV